VISSLHRRHRTIEFKKFLGKIDAGVLSDTLGGDDEGGQRRAGW